MMRIRGFMVLAFIACASFARAAEPATPPSCAILSGSGNRAPDPAVRAVLEARLFADLGLRFVEREEVARVVQEHNLASAEWSASASRVQLGAIIPADVLLFLQGISGGSNTQTRIDVTESRSGVMLGSWIEENAAIRSAPDAIVARMRTAAEKSRIPPEARHLIGLLDFRGEESGLQMESAATTLSDLTIPALSRIPNVLVLDREHIEHLQTERDLTAMEAKLRPSVMLLEGGLRTGGTTNEYAVTVQLRRLAGGGMTNRAIVAPRADLVAARDRVVEVVAAMLGAVPSGTTDVSRAEEAAAFARQIPLWDRWGDHARAIRAAEAAFAIEPSQGNRWALASELFRREEGTLPETLRAMQIQLDYYRVRLAAIAAGSETDLVLPLLRLSSRKVAAWPQSEQAREAARLDEAAFRLALRHYAAHYDECDRLYWEAWRRRLAQYPSLLPEVFDAFAAPPSLPDRYSASRLLVFGDPRSGVTPELADRMVRHPHPFPRLIGHSFRERNGRSAATVTQALESRHAIFKILTEEVPATHPYRQHLQDRLPWLVMDQWLSMFLPVDSLSQWPVAVPRDGSERDFVDKIRYIDSLLASGEPTRIFVLGFSRLLSLEPFTGPEGECYDASGPLFDWLREIASGGRQAEAYRLAAEAGRMTREQTLPACWSGFRASSENARGQTPWIEQLAAAEKEFRQMLDVSGIRVQSALPPRDALSTSSVARTNPSKFDTRRFDGGRRDPQVPSDPQALWQEYAYQWIPLGVSLRGDSIVSADGNRVCVARLCGGHAPQAGMGVHVYVFWAGSGALLAERHATAPVQNAAEGLSAPSVCSVALAGDLAYVGLSSGLLSVPLGSGDVRLLSEKDGLPGQSVRAVGVYGGLVYLSLSGNGGVLASWDPASNRISVVAAEKAVSPRNMLDGTRLELTALVGDRENHCVWLGGYGPTSAGPDRIGVWRYDPVERTITRANEAASSFLAEMRTKGGRLFVPSTRSLFELCSFMGQRSAASDGTNVVDVMLNVSGQDEHGVSRRVSKTSLVCRDRPSILITVLPDGTPFPEPELVLRTDSGVIAIMKDGRVGLIRRKDMTSTYLDAECRAVSGNPDETRLLRAAAGGNQDQLRRSLEAGAKIEATDGEGKTALMYAAREGQSVAAGALLDRGANARAGSIGGVSVLAFAAQGGDTSTVVRLLQMGVAPSGRSRVGMTPLLYAASGGHSDMVRLLLANGANRDETDSDGRSALCLAIERQSPATVDCLLRSGMNPNARGWRGLPPLMLASERDDMEIVKMVCKAGGDTTAVVPSRVEWEPSLPLLAKSAREGRTALVKALLEAGANREILDEERSTPLIHAAFMGRLEAARALLDAGANIEAENKWECRPLFLSVYKGRSDVARLLIERKADVNRQDNQGSTPLHEAAASRQWEIVKLLLEHGADPKIKNKKGEQPVVPGK